MTTMEIPSLGSLVIVSPFDLILFFFCHGVSASLLLRWWKNSHTSAALWAFTLWDYSSY